MGNADTGVVKAGFGVLETIPRVWTTDALGTTQVQVGLVDYTVVSGGRAREIQVLIENPSTTATLAWMIVPKGTTPTPPIVSSYAAAAVAGSPIPPGKSAKFVLLSAFDLWIVSSAAATSVAVTSALNG